MRSSAFWNQRGLTLAEIGMALFAIGLGVLSIATVYLQREKTASITEQQATAQALTTEMTSRVAAQQNPDVRFENAIGVHCAQTLNNASPQALATNDVACWQERVAAQLPNGAGSILLDTVAVPATYAVTVSWSRPRGGLASYTVRVVAVASGATAARAQTSNGVRAAN
jgi:Tfp pilus assembly protein PilV